MRKERDPKSFQPGLFQPAAKIPTWKTLHGEVQQKAIRLLSQLLRQYWKSHHALQSEEAGHE